MTIDPQSCAPRLRLAGLGAFAALALGGCAETSLMTQPRDAAFGEANRQTMMAQVINPDPVYDTRMTASGHMAAEAIDRYRNDNVKQPESIRTTNVGDGSGTGPN